MLDYAISAQKYPKIVMQEKKNSRNPQQCFFRVFLRSFDVVFHMFRCINQTFHQNKKICWNKTGEGIMVLDYAISAQKYPKIVQQEKKKNYALFFPCVNT